MSSMENISPQAMRCLMKEFKTLTTSPPEGIKVFMPDESNVTEIHASIEGSQGTPYEGGVFKMKLKLGRDFPQQPPKGFFLTKIFHPNVAENGEICVNTLKRDWKETHGIKHILLTIKCLLIVPNPESALNEEAGKLLLEDYAAYCKKAKLWTKVHAAAESTTSSSSSSSKKKKSSKRSKKSSSKKKNKKNALKRL
mmetsp:Transcript_16520/g.24653  ORF Transcript_16520/g.24653 Transcript_16520/m.24653 type:complete len:196 (-) Transcript_16520:26-613(-)